MHLLIARGTPVREHHHIEVPAERRARSRLAAQVRHCPGYDDRRNAALVQAVFELRAEERVVL